MFIPQCLHCFCRESKKDKQRSGTDTIRSHICTICALFLFPVSFKDPGFTVMFLSFQTDKSGQTVQTQIRLLQRSSLIRVYTVCHSLCIVWTYYSMVEPHSSNFRVITTNVLGVRIFRKPTVHSMTQDFTFISLCLLLSFSGVNGFYNL